MNFPRKILVIRLSSLGDILHALPAFHDLRNTFPDARIDWAVARNCAFLLSAVRGIGKVYSFDKTALLALQSRHETSLPLPALIRSLRRERYDICIDFQGLLKTAIIGFMSGARVRIGFPGDQVRERPSHWFYGRTPAIPGEPEHVVDLNRRLAECAGARRHTFAFDPVFSREDRDLVESLLEKYGVDRPVVLNPGGGWKSKVWDSARYGELAAGIRTELGLDVVVTTGPGEEALYEKIAAYCGKPAPVHLQVSFLQMMPLLERARLLIGGDTGPLHLACALRTPVVAIFGPTSATRNGPWNTESEVVTNGIHCGGCYKRNCPTDSGCMDIPVGDVFAAVTRIVEKAAGRPI